MRLGLSLVGVCILGACALRPTPGSSAPTSAAGLPAAWSYRVTIGGETAQAIDYADVELCFEGRAPARLVARGSASVEALRDVRGDPSGSLPIEGTTIDTRDLGRDGCVEYRVDFPALVEAVAKDDWQQAFWLDGDHHAVVIRPALWLWRPERYRRDPQIKLDVSMPESMALSTSWTSLDPAAADGRRRYALDATVYRWMNFWALGQLQHQRFERSGADVEIMRRGYPVPMSDEGWRGWITDAVDGVALLYGQFPRERLQVFTIPLPSDHDDPVLGGFACRGGGPGVFLWFNAEAEDDELPGHWVTIHELLHLGMPYVKERWMSEGLVTYYTEVLRTRQGHRSERRGWQGMLGGFERGRADTREMALVEASARMNELGMHHRVYWSGAALALQLDVALRIDSGGERSLDDAMRELRRCCADAKVRVSATSLLEHLDAWYGKPLFTEIIRPRLDDLLFPDMGPTLERLGLGPSGEARVLDPEHPGASLRRSIMMPAASAEQIEPAP